MCDSGHFSNADKIYPPVTGLNDQDADSIP